MKQKYCIDVSSFLLLLLTIIIAVINSNPINHDEVTKNEENFDIILLHNNDMHGRFEETEKNSGSCQEGHRNNSCIAGMARTAHLIREYRKRAKNGTGPPVLYLNAGDNFIGTTWFTVFTWNITSKFLNLLKPDALCLGNHEFDLSDTVLAPFIDHLQSPVVAANLNFSEVPSLNGKINSSVILEVADGRRIGIIGYLTPETVKISNVGKVRFENEIVAVRRESERLRSQGVNIIIALGHSGYLMDKMIAKEVELVDVVIGGHTNTFLWNGPLQPDSEPINGPYPTVIEQKNGKKVPVVQAYAYTKYLGVLNCTFNSNGDLVAFAGQPILMQQTIPQEQDFLELLDEYRPTIDGLNKEIIGQSRVLLNGATCRYEECNLGNLITDSFIHYATTESVEQWTNVPISLYNGGGIRISINPQNGAVTRRDLLEALPFGNQIVVLKLNGSSLLEAMEQTVRSNGETSLGEFPQISGLRLTLDMTQPTSHRVISLKARCGLCAIPIYEDVLPHRNYSLITSSFLANGGDGITVLRDKFLDSRVMDLSEIDAIVNYFRKFSPIYTELQDRIRFVKNANNMANINIINLTILCMCLLLNYFMTST